MEKSIIKFNNKLNPMGGSLIIAIPPPILDAFKLAKDDEMEICIATEGKKKYILMEKGDE